MTLKRVSLDRYQIFLVFRKAEATDPGSSIVTRSVWEPVEIAKQLGMDNRNTFEKIYLEINLFLEVLSNIFDKNLLFPLIF